MTATPERLQRLTRAQGEMVKVLEAALLRKEQRAMAALAEWRELQALAERSAGVQPALLPGLLRNLVSVELKLKQAESDTAFARQKLLQAKGRLNAISDKMIQLDERQSRREAEIMALEVSVSMMPKASGKGGVVK